MPNGDFLLQAPEAGFQVLYVDIGGVGARQVDHFRAMHWLGTDVRQG
jgi:hypothetical protein